MKLPNFLKSKKNGNKTGSNRSVQTMAHRIARDPYVDWAIVFIAAVIISVLLVVIGIYTYINMGSELTQASPQSHSPAAVDTKDLNKVLDQFNERATERAVLLQGYSGPGDPSL